MSSEDGEESAKSIADTPPVPPRDDLVKTAAQFLQSPKVYKSPMDMKTAFLKKKGLSDAEIELAVKLSEEIVQSKASKKTHLGLPYTAIDIPHAYGQPPALYWSHQPRWMKYRDIANTVALLGGIIYAAFWFYKKYIAPYLFGLGRTSLDTRLSDLEKNLMIYVTEIKTGINEIRQEFERVSERKGDIVNKQIEELKSEITSLKKLLLNRKQFPSAVTATGPLSIPAWQRASSPPEEKDIEEEGNGTNGSDSSLEMIKE